jgi:hypothetical protein
MEAASNREPSPYSSPMFFLPIIVGFMFAGLGAFVFASSNGWASFLALLFFSVGDAGVSLLVAGMVFGFPIATIAAGFLLMPIAIAVTPSGIVYTTRLKREIFAWDSLLPATGVPGGSWAPFRFTSVTGNGTCIRWIDRVRAKQIMRDAPVPPKFFPKAYWEWAGIAGPTSLPEPPPPLRSGS